MENIKGGWFMATAPVMNCKKLSIQEKVLLSCIMSMKNSMETVYATDEKIMGMTGLNQNEFIDTCFSLEQKKLIRKVTNEWRLLAGNINVTLGITIYPFAENINKDAKKEIDETPLQLKKKKSIQPKRKHSRMPEAKTGELF